MDKATLRKTILVTAGIICVGVAMLGIFVPVLPTTPFLLLAAACFVRSSDRLYNWLVHHKWFGNYIRYYREYRAVTLKSKILALVMLWGVIGYTAFGVIDNWWLRGLLGVIAVGVTLHLTHIKTLTPEMVQSSQNCFEGGET
ncbi:MAG TPA: YbaN family protein [Anaerolineae bacterium]|nr:YbaN family protein [Anaerolineae bacterium]HQI87584.1 YbaN family protein [Anaerolineae bacterium]